MRDGLSVVCSQLRRAFWGGQKVLSLAIFRYTFYYRALLQSLASVSAWLFHVSSSVILYLCDLVRHFHVLHFE